MKTVNGKQEAGALQRAAASLFSCTSIVSFLILPATCAAVVAPIGIYGLYWPCPPSSERKEFIAANLPQNKSSGTDEKTLTADEMSVFYKTFLDKNWKVHKRYNAEWYRKNIELVIFALRVKIFKAKRWVMTRTK
ncbi:hypothetical protein Cfor_02042 [Coptotermes formosanus]|uniref:Uncharacterized protein n=1 Tax=Coptotermes formosanus TaxID=36987 RepID=A0A6L2PP54_COPFO|nr:hypothetical protein Cfor_02042 [Coptotermes formosanus]